MEENVEYDFKQIVSDLKKITKSIEFELIGFSIPNQWEIENIPKSKDYNSSMHTYMATFFCKDKEDWFIKKIILSAKDDTIFFGTKELASSLESKARAILDAHKQSKNPLKYLTDINISSE